MAYVLVAVIKGGKYWVQHYQNIACLNGLINNAVSFANEEIAKEAKRHYEKYFTPELHIEEILPRTKQ